MTIELKVISDSFIRKNLLFDQISNNLANSGTVGFKAERLIFEPGPATSEGMVLSSPVYTPRVITDFNEGNMEQTGNPLDIAIEGKGFFTVLTPEGEVYTRKGNFTVNGGGELVTQTGYPVLGESGKIIIQGSEVQVQPDGTVTVDDADAGKLKITGFRNMDGLERAAGGSFRDSGGGDPYPAEEATVQSGFLERSNVNVISQMIEMMDVHRSLESYQKIIQTMADQDKMSTTRIGRLI